MRKPTRDPTQPRPPVQRWMRQPPDAAARARPGAVAAQRAPSPTTSANKARPAQRFIQPYPFADEQRRAIDQALARAGIDDAIGRELFIGAIAYELAVMRARLADEPNTAAPAAGAPGAEAAEMTGVPAIAESGPTREIEVPDTLAPAGSGAGSEPPTTAAGGTGLAAVGAGARALVQRLERLEPGARERLAGALMAADPFARGYDDAYLAALTAELGRLAAAVAAAEADPDPEARPDVASGIAPQGAAGSAPGNGSDGAAENGARAGAGRSGGPTATRPRSGAPASHSWPASPSHPQPPAGHGAEAPPALAEAPRAFIRDAARVYRECFERAPDACAASPFAKALAAVAEASGTPIPTRPKDLEAALRDAP